MRHTSFSYKAAKAALKSVLTVAGVLVVLVTFVNPAHATPPCPTKAPVATGSDSGVIYDPTDSSMKACINGAWVTLSAGGGGVTALAGLTTDVTITSPTTGQALVYNGGHWINSPLSFTESDPQVGTVTANKWCAANAGGTAIDCNQNAPGAGGITALTGDVTASGTGSVASTIANGVVTYAKIQNVSATNKLLGRSTAGAGSIEELSIGSGLSLSSGTLSATGSSQWTTSGSDIYYNTAGNVGVGTATPGQKLTVAGTIESTTGGIKFPNGTTQAKAVTPSSFSTVSASVNSTATGGTSSWSSKVYATCPGGSSLVFWALTGSYSGNYTQYHYCLTGQENATQAYVMILDDGNNINFMCMVTAFCMAN